MNVTVKLKGALGRLDRKPASGPVEVAMPAGATAGELVSRLADHFGSPFGDPTCNGDWLPRGIRMFVGGQMALRGDEPLAPPEAESQKVIVILVTQMQGG